MRLAAQLLEHPLRVAAVGGLRVDASTEHDGRVDAEHRPAARVCCNRARLAEGLLAHELLCIRCRGIVLDVLGRDDVERNAELLEDCATLRRRRREEQRGCRRNAHAISATPNSARTASVSSGSSRAWKTTR